MPPKGDLARIRLLALVRRDPGVGVGEAARHLGWDPTTAAYHARVLARAGVLVVDRAGRCRALFENGDGACAWMRQALPVLRDPDARVAAALLLQGPLAPWALQREAELPRGKAGRVLRRLARQGIAERARSGHARPIAGRAPCLERALLGQRCSASPRCPLAPPSERTLTLSPSPSGRMIGTDGLRAGAAVERRWAPAEDPDPFVRGLQPARFLNARRNL